MTAPQIANGGRRSSTTFEPTRIRAFLRHLVTSGGLPIGLDERGEYSEETPLMRFGQRPTFLRAKTGVGKTVAVPVRELCRACDTLVGSDERKIFVVEPRIPICEAMREHMNAHWRRFNKIDGIAAPPLFGSVTSSTGSVSPSAPIQFVTTGILEAMALAGDFSVERHRVIIDEAHVTIPQSEGVELAIALLRAEGVPLSYMSATVRVEGIGAELGVDVLDAGQQRYPILYVVMPDATLSAKAEQEADTRRTIEKLLTTLLVSPAAFFAEYGRTDDRVVSAVRGALTEGPARPVGMLIVVNSHASERSETATIARIVERFGIPALRLASEIVRDPVKKARFDEKIERIERDNGRYVIVTTNVVEMGVTFNSLDVVVTLDSEFRERATDEGSLLEVADLSANALAQRAGRVGRCRPGLCVIIPDRSVPTRAGAPYTRLGPEELNRRMASGELAERLRLPLSQSPPRVDLLALYCIRHDVPDPAAWLRGLPLASAARDHRWSDAAAASLTRCHERWCRTSPPATPARALGLRVLTALPMLHRPEPLDLLLRASDDPTELALAIVAVAAPSTCLGEVVRGLEPDARSVDEDEFLSCEELGADVAEVSEALRAVGAAGPLMMLPRDILNAPRLRGLLRRGFRLATKAQLDQVDSNDRGRMLWLRRPVIQLSPRSDLVSLYRLVRWYFNAFFSPLATSHAGDELLRVDRDILRERASAACDRLGVNAGALSTIVREVAEYRRRLGKLPEFRASLEESALPDAPNDAVPEKFWASSYFSEFELRRPPDDNACVAVERSTGREVYVSDRRSGIATPARHASARAFGRLVLSRRRGGTVEAPLLEVAHLSVSEG